MNVKLASNEKIAETSSKGNQEKWKDGELWYKLDHFGYEALAETLTSIILEESNIEKETPFRFVRYEMSSVIAHGRERTCCISHHFLNEFQSLITVNTLIKKKYGVPIIESLKKLPSCKKRILYLADAVKECSGLDAFPEYLTLLFEIDSLIVNDDRHLNNIAVLEENGKYAYCPVFDNGAGLLSNMMILRADIEPKALIRSLKAEPFGMTFNRTIKTVRDMFGKVLQIPFFSKSDIYDRLSPLLVYYPERDRSIISDRVIECISERQLQYQ